MTAASGFAVTATRTGNSTSTGLMRLRIASINDLPISEAERKYHWPLGPASRRSIPSLSALGL